VFANAGAASWALREEEVGEVDQIAPPPEAAA